MRPDVKLGVVISMVVVLVAGTYYLYRDERERPIRVAEELGMPSGPVEDVQRPDPVANPTYHARRPGEADVARGPASTRRRDVAAREGGATQSQPRGVTRAPEVSTKTASRRRDPGESKPRFIDPRIVEPQAGPPSSGEVARADGARTRAPAGTRGKLPSRAMRPVPLAASKPATTLREPAKAEYTAGRGAAVDTHRVQSGDTFSSLAERYYGSTRFTRFLINSNHQIADPNRLRLGTMVRIPPRPDVAALHESASPTPAARKTADGRSTYVVKPGDSFYAIARDELGDATRWKELFELNRRTVGGDPTRLKVGQLLVLPGR